MVNGLVVCVCCTLHTYRTSHLLKRRDGAHRGSAGILTADNLFSSCTPTQIPNPGAVHSHFVPLVPDPSIPCSGQTIRHIAATALELFAHELVVRLGVMAPWRHTHKHEIQGMHASMHCRLCAQCKLRISYTRQLLRVFWLARKTKIIVPATYLSFPINRAARHTASIENRDGYQTGYLFCCHKLTCSSAERTYYRHLCSQIYILPVSKLGSKQRPIASSLLPKPKLMNVVQPKMFLRSKIAVLSWESRRGGVFTPANTPPA